MVLSDGVPNWVVTRAADKAAVLQFTVYDVNAIGLDPSINPVATTRLRKGLKVKYQVQTGGTWTTELTATIRKVTVDPNPKNARNGLRPITVNASNTVTDLILHSHGQGAGSTDDVRYVLTGYDYNVNGSTSAKATPDEDVYENDDSNMWETLLVTRDSQDFFLHVDKDDVVVVTDRASKTTSTVADFTDADYSDVNLDYTIVDIINDVTIKITKKNANGKYTLRNTIHRTDSTSIDKYGHRKRTYTMHNRADALDYADEILSTNADPQVTPHGCTVPIRSESAITNFIQGIDLNDKVTIEDPDGTVFTVRVNATKETVAPDSWLKEFTFKNPTVKSLPRQTLGTGVANVTDGQVETAFMNDKAITTAKIDDLAVGTAQLADGAVTADKVPTSFYTDIGGHGFTTSGTAPSSPVIDDYWVDSSNGYELFQYNGTSWVSIQDAAIATAQAAADAAQTDADTAQTTADGKNTVTYSTSTPGTTANTAGDIWFQTSGATIIGQWKGNGGTSWTSVTLTNSVISTLDAGKITTGTLSASRIATGSLDASKITSATITATQIASSTITATQIAASTITGAKIAAGTITSGLLAANAVVAGKIAAGAIDGMTITGAIIQTATSASRIVMNDAGATGDQLRFYPNGANGGTYGYIGILENVASPTTPISLLLSTPASTNFPNRRNATFNGDTAVGGTSSMADFSNFYETRVNKLRAFSAVTADSDVTVGGNIVASGPIHGTKLFADTPDSQTGSANIRFNANNQIVNATSLSKFKLDQKPIELQDAKGLLKLTPITWFDKSDADENGGTDGLIRIPGVTAEDVEQHAPVFADYRNGELSGVSYDRMASGLILIIKDQQARIDDQQKRIEQLEKMVGA